MPSKNKKQKNKIQNPKGTITVHLFSVYESWEIRIIVIYSKKMFQAKFGFIKTISLNKLSPAEHIKTI